MATRTLASTSIFLAPASALFMAGYSWAFTQNVMPLLYNDGDPQQTTPIFRQIFYGGAFVALPCSTASWVMSAYLAYLCKAAGQQKLYLAAAAASLATGPITIGIMMPGIKRLIAISESEVEQEKSEQTLEHLQLLKSWSYWMVSGLCCIWQVEVRVCGPGYLARIS